MRVSIVVGPEGVERVVSMGQGLEATEEALEFVDAIWGEVQTFHTAIVDRLRKRVEPQQKT